MKQFDKVLVIIAAGILAIFVFATRAHCQIPSPATLSKNDGQPLTVGTRFASVGKNVITGIRYFRDANFTGSTVGHLWKNGSLVESGTFPSGTGWVTLVLKSPVVANAGEVFTVSYSNDGGFYSFLANYFPRTFPLWQGQTGLYIYARNAHPTQAYQNSLYFVEPVLQPYVEAPKADTVFIRDTIRITKTDTIINIIYDTDTIFQLCPDTTIVLLDAYDTIGARFPDYKIYGEFEFTMPLNKKVRFVRRIEAIWRREELVNGVWIEK